MYHPLCTRTSRGNRALQCVGAPCCTSRTHARRGASARAANVSKLHRRFRCAGGLLCAACVRTDAPMTLSDPFHSVPSTEWPSLAYLWPSLKVPSSELKPVLRCCATAARSTILLTAAASRSHREAGASWMSAKLFKKDRARTRHCTQLRDIRACSQKITAACRVPLAHTATGGGRPAHAAAETACKVLPAIVLW